MADWRDSLGYFADYSWSRAGGPQTGGYLAGSAVYEIADRTCGALNH